MAQIRLTTNPRASHRLCIHSSRITSANSISGSRALHDVGVVDARFHGLGNPRELNRSRYWVDEFAVPELEHVQRPQPLRLVRGARAVTVEHRAHRVGAKVTAGQRAWIEQH